MNPPIERRNFFTVAFAGAVLGNVGIQPLDASTRDASPSVDRTFPKQDPAMVQEMVRVSHGDLTRVKQLLEAHPALARAAVDWGFGDWEDALGAASHTGRYEIAELLIKYGARPTLFSATMMGQLETVKGFISAAPGCQRILGPHGLTLLSHARAGGERAQATRAYLEQLGDADVAPPTVPLDRALHAIYVGTYAFGSAADEQLQVTSDEKNGLAIARLGLSGGRNLRHRGNHEFFPVGAEAVRVRFAVVGERATTVEVLDPDVIVTGTRLS